MAPSRAARERRVAGGDEVGNCMMRWAGSRMMDSIAAEPLFDGSEAFFERADAAVEFLSCGDVDHGDGIVVHGAEVLQNS